MPAGGFRVHDGTARWIFVAFVLLSAVPIGVFVLSRTLNMNLDVLLRDTSAAAGVPYYFGWVSNLGILMWGAAAGACALTYLGLRGRVHRAVSIFFLSSFLLTALLGLDDGLLWHEEFLPARGIPEPVVYAAYGTAVLAWFVINRRYFGHSRFAVLAAAVGLFAFAIGMDLYELVFPPLAVQIVLEDGAKFVGIGLWLSYFVIEGRVRIRSHVEATVGTGPERSSGSSR